jgi:hypothetical protein
MIGEIGGVSTGIGYTALRMYPGLTLIHKFCKILNGYRLPGIQFYPVLQALLFFLQGSGGLWSAALHH